VYPGTLKRLFSKVPHLEKLRLKKGTRVKRVGHLGRRRLNCELLIVLMRE
jgi:hypothetical protein